jgi:hypothetical protein
LLAVHPDADAYTVTPELQRAADAAAVERPEVAEVVWARDVLARKVRDTVTGNGLRAPEAATRHKRVCKACEGKRRNPYSGEPYEVITNYTRREVRWVGYCRLCAADAENERQREARAAARAGRACEGCGEAFTPSRADGRHCTPACRQRAYRQRQAADRGSAAPHP